MAPRLAVIPLLPWALPRFGGFLQTLSRYVSKVDVGSVKIDLRDVTDTPIAVSTSSGVPPGLSDNVSALSSSTGIVSVIAALRSLQLQGGRPYATIDLQTGRKWRLPNLYYLSVLLERDPVVSLLFFTEMRRGIDGYFVRMGRPRELRVQIEQALPAYGEARSAVQLPAGGDLQEPNTAQQLANAFTQFRDKLPPDSGTENDLVFGFITAERLNALVVSPPGAIVESPGDTLSGGAVNSCAPW
jgi:hypothetical protein